jgi:peptide/nickel transport system substrate-binding protein
MAPLLWIGVTLADRKGAMSKPLGSLQVRQALNYATNRVSIATALFPGNGTPADQVTVPGGYGYQSSLNSAYPYNIAKAKQLLAQAGYPHGFTLKLVSTDSGGQSLVAQALAQQWKQIGVNLQITDYANANTFYSAAFAPKFPAFMTVYGQQPIWIEGPGLFLPAALFNPFHTADATLQSLYNQEAQASGAQQSSLDQQVEAYMVNQAWFVPVLTQGLPFYATSDITGTSVSAQAPLAELYEAQPSSRFAAYRSAAIPRGGAQSATPRKHRHRGSPSPSPRPADSRREGTRAQTDLPVACLIGCPAVRRHHTDVPAVVTGAGQRGQGHLVRTDHQLHAGSVPAGTS